MCHYHQLTVQLRAQLRRLKNNLSCLPVCLVTPEHFIQRLTPLPFSSLLTLDVPLQS